MGKTRSNGSVKYDATTSKVVWTKKPSGRTCHLSWVIKVETWRVHQVGKSKETGNTNAAIFRGNLRGWGKDYWWQDHSIWGWAFHLQWDWKERGSCEVSCKSFSASRWAFAYRNRYYAKQELAYSAENKWGRDLGWRRVTKGWKSHREELSTSGPRINKKKAGWGGRWKWGFRRVGTYVFLWLIHIDVWKEPTQYCKAIILP